MTQRITKSTVEEYLAKNAPHLGAYENKMNKDKGIYRRDAGPAFSFKVKGKTWREVMDAITQ